MAIELIIGIFFGFCATWVFLLIIKRQKKYSSHSDSSSKRSQPDDLSNNEPDYATQVEEEDCRCGAPGGSCCWK